MKSSYPISYFTAYFQTQLSSFDGGYIATWTSSHDDDIIICCTHHIQSFFSRGNMGIMAVIVSKSYLDCQTRQLKKFGTLGRWSAQIQSHIYREYEQTCIIKLQTHDWIDFFPLHRLANKYDRNKRGNTQEKPLSFCSPVRSPYFVPLFDHHNTTNSFRRLILSPISMH